MKLAIDIFLVLLHCISGFSFSSNDCGEDEISKNQNNLNLT